MARMLVPRRISEQLGAKPDVPKIPPMNTPPPKNAAELYAMVQLRIDTSPPGWIAIAPPEHVLHEAVLRRNVELLITIDELKDHARYWAGGGAVGHHGLV